ncbi:MAG: cellulase family glycosylhydrolase, partial [Candidatus Bipolaricaulia bacterium]
MRIGRLVAIGLVLLSLGISFTRGPATAEIGDWTRTARIATPWDYPSGTFESWEEAVDQAVADGANVILDWHAVSDYWQALYEPLLSQDLEEMAYHANYVHTHHPGVRYIIYVAPLEYVTPDVDVNQDGQVDPGKEEESLAIQHPDWAQIGLDGRRAVFYGAYPGMPFWVCETCEDVWLTPANPEYRALALEQARRIATTGIDGVWFDVPFLRFEFGENWQEQWPTFDPWAQAQFQAETGYSMPTAVDWNDPAWRAFVRWRYTLTADFIEDYRAALQQGNPNIKLIIETSVGPDVTATQQGSSTLDLPGVSDLTAHEHGGPWGSSEFHYYMWLRFLADLLLFDHTDGDQPSWLLSYVKAGEPDTVDMARLHAAMVLTAGTNYYTSGNETMAGMPEVNFRRQLFSWLAAEEQTYYGPGWRPYANVALVYSQQTLDFLDRGSWESPFAYHDAFPGMAMMLLELHIPFEVISERELNRLVNYDVAILPMFAAMSPQQAQAIRDYVASGRTIIATGPASLYNEEGVQLSDFQLADLFGVHYAEVQPGQVYVNDYGSGRAIFFYSLEPGWILTHELDYFWSAEPWEGGVPDPAGAEQARQAFLTDLWSQAEVEPLLSTAAPRGVVLLPYRSANGLTLRALNFYGVNYGDAVTTPITVDLTLRLPSGRGPTAAQRLEFLGGWQSQDFSQPDAQHVRMSFPLSTHAVAELELNAAEPVSFGVTREGDVYADWVYYCGKSSGCFNPGTGADLAESILAGVGLGSLPAASASPPAGFLSVQGKDILDGNGQPIYLRGVNMDTYYYSYLWDAAAPWTYATQADIQYLASLGVTAIRLGLHWRYFNTPMGYALIDTYLDWCEQAGIYVILDMHVVPPEDDVLEGKMWDNPAAQQQFLDLWTAIAA